MPFYPTEDDDIIGERIHDSECNENMVHYLHLFFMDKITKEQLEEKFNKAYKEEEYISPPWENE